MLAPIEHRIALELGVRPAQVNAAITLLDEGATVPFISRYRKEATGGLDDTQLRNLEERLTYLRDLEDRRAAILASINEQGKLTPELKAEMRTPKPSSASKTSTCPTSRNAAPRRRSPAKPASSRWRWPCSATRI
jgi:transcriptional accessory protein Tex/SPT6